MQKKFTRTVTHPDGGGMKATLDGDELILEGWYDGVTPLGCIRISVADLVAAQAAAPQKKLKKMVRKIIALKNPNFSLSGASVEAEIITFAGARKLIPLHGWEAGHARVGDTLFCYSDGRTELVRDKEGTQ